MDIKKGQPRCPFLFIELMSFRLIIHELPQPVLCNIKQADSFSI